MSKSKVWLLLDHYIPLRTMLTMLALLGSLWLAGAKMEAFLVTWFNSVNGHIEALTDSVSTLATTVSGMKLDLLANTKDITLLKCRIYGTCR